MQHLRAREMPAQAQQRQIGAELERVAVPEHDRRVGAHGPLAVIGVKIDRRAAEGPAPLDHGRVVVRVRDGDRGNAAQRLDHAHRRAVDKADAVPQHVLAWPALNFRRRQQRALADRELRLSADAEQAIALLLECKAMARAQVLKRRPLLTGPADELPLVLADRAGLRRRLVRCELGPAGDTDGVHAHELSSPTGRLIHGSPSIRRANRCTDGPASHTDVAV